VRGGLQIAALGGVKGIAQPSYSRAGTTSPGTVQDQAFGAGSTSSAADANPGRSLSLSTPGGIAFWLGFGATVALAAIYYSLPE